MRALEIVPFSTSLRALEIAQSATSAFSAGPFVMSNISLPAAHGLNIGKNKARKPSEAARKNLITALSVCGRSIQSVMFKGSAALSLYFLRVCVHGIGTLKIDLDEGALK